MEEKSERLIYPIRRVPRDLFHPLRALLIAKLLKTNPNDELWWNVWYTSGLIDGIDGISNWTSVRSLKERRELIQKQLPLDINALICSKCSKEEDDLKVAQLTQVGHDWNLMEYIMTPSVKKWINQNCSVVGRLLIWSIQLSPSVG